MYVADATGQTITAMQRKMGDPTVLESVSQYRTRHMLDNIEVLGARFAPNDAVAASEVVLTGGSIPLPATSETACEEHLGATLEFAGTTVGCGKSPGSMGPPSGCHSPVARSCYPR